MARSDLLKRLEALEGRGRAAKSVEAALDCVEAIVAAETRLETEKAQRTSKADLKRLERELRAAHDAYAALGMDAAIDAAIDEALAEGARLLERAGQSLPGTLSRVSHEPTRPTPRLRGDRRA